TNIFSDLKQLDNAELSHLYELVSLHTEALFIVGHLATEAQYERDTAYADRKSISVAIILGRVGTVAVKQAQAQLAIKAYLQNEDEANDMYSKYKLMYESLNHRLIDFRQKRNKLEDELKLTNDIQ